MPDDQPPIPLSSLLSTRHSTRAFLPTPIPKPLLLTTLHSASHAPSNSNMQNWRVSLATGPSRTHIITTLSSHAATHGPAIPPLPPGMKSHRDDFVNLLYGPAGYDVLGEEKREERQEKRMANFRFFDAPVIGIVWQERKMGRVDAMCVGMFLQSFLLGLWERGVGSCCQVSVTGYKEVLIREFGVPFGVDEVDVLCGLAIGYEDVSKRENQIRTGRDEVEDFVTFLE